MEHDLNNKIRIWRWRLLRWMGKPALSEPGSIDVEPTVRCNLHCPMCQTSHWQRTAPDLTPALFERILDSFPGLDHVKLQGMGEPLLNRDIFELVAMARSRNVGVTICTNGTVLTERNIAGLKTSGAGEIFVSCDHWDPSVLAQIRPGLDPVRYRAGVQSLNRATISGGPRVSAWTLVTEHLGKQEHRFAEYVKEAGFRAISLQTDITSWGTEGEKEEGPNQSQIDSLVAALRENAGCSVTVVATNRFSPTRPCPWPSYHCYVTAEGMVQPCCIMSDPGRFTFGSLLKKPFWRIWNSNDYFRFRDSFSSMKLNDFCRHCYRKNAN